MMTQRDVGGGRNGRQIRPSHYNPPISSNICKKKLTGLIAVANIFLTKETHHTKVSVISRDKLSK